MKRIDGSKVCNVLSALLLAGFIVSTAADYFRYSSTLNSAPFYLWVVVNAICFLAPAGLSLAIGVFLKYRKQKI